MALIAVRVPIIYCSMMVPHELNKVIQGKHVAPSPVQSLDNSPTMDPVPKRPISPRDACPICLENLIQSRRLLTRCRYGCGRPLHMSCMLVLAKFQKQELTDKTMIKCPMCRGDFCTWEDLHKEHLRNKQLRPRRVRLPALVPPSPLVLHAGITCTACLTSPVLGALYRCSQCPLVTLCEKCASGTAGESVIALHHQHGLIVRQRPRDWWRPARTDSTTPSELAVPDMKQKAPRVEPTREQQYGLFVSSSKIRQDGRSSRLSCSLRSTRHRLPAILQVAHGTDGHRFADTGMRKRQMKKSSQLDGLGSALNVQGLNLTDRRDQNKPLRDTSPSPILATSLSKLPGWRPPPSSCSSLSVTSLDLPDHLTPALSPRRQHKQTTAPRCWASSRGRRKPPLGSLQVTCSRVQLSPRPRLSQK